MKENGEKAIQLLHKKLAYKPKQINAVIQLIEEGNTIPFIARYRKEMIGSLDEVSIYEIEEKYHYFLKLEARKEEIIRLIAEQDKLTPELEMKIKKVEKHQNLEDIYLPYKQKKRTKAMIAKERGLEPLACFLMQCKGGDPEIEATKYISSKSEIHSATDALQGAHEMIAEQISNRSDFRDFIRNFTRSFGIIKSTVRNSEADEKKVYEMYYDFSENVNRLAHHRVLAFNRGEKENILRISVMVDTTKIFHYMNKQILKENGSKATEFVRSAIKDAYKRFIAPAIEREIRAELTEKAENHAIHVFSANLQKLLLQPPLKGKRVLGIDPAYRTGCKFAVLNETGKVIEIGVVYPHTAKAKKPEAKAKIITLLQKYTIEIVAIGNGTASRETEQFVAEILKETSSQTKYVIVNEAGASVYSASKEAREEFPDYKVEERSAISIGRRLQDPLSELVKIDPKSVGVGQYQRDIAQKKLSNALTFVVETAVNQVGVNVNTASPSLLQYVAGLNKKVAKNICLYREENGPFTSRKELKKVPRLGEKSYEQSVGFMRILEGRNPLDKTAIHPESYDVAQALIDRTGFTVNDIGTEKLKQALRRLDIDAIANELERGKETLADIISDLISPLRDPRDGFDMPLLKQDVMTMEDLKPGMKLQGTVRNVVDFGAFIDVGVKQDGLVHLSKLSASFVRNPMEIVSVGEIVEVWVEKMEIEKGRISLTMVDPMAKKSK